MPCLPPRRLDTRRRFCDALNGMSLDSHLSYAQEEERRSGSRPVLAVDWAPAYELLISFGCFVSARMHPLIDLGPAWVRDVRQALPAESAAQLARKNTSASFKEADDDRLMLLARV